MSSVSSAGGSQKKVKAAVRKEIADMEECESRQQNDVIEPGQGDDMDIIENTEEMSDADIRGPSAPSRLPTMSTPSKHFTKRFIAERLFAKTILGMLFHRNEQIIDLHLQLRIGIPDVGLVVAVQDVRVTESIGGLEDEVECDVDGSDSLQRS